MPVVEFVAFNQDSLDREGFSYGSFLERLEEIRRLYAMATDSN
jgi:hypothetical protein